MELKEFSILPVFVKTFGKKIKIQDYSGGPHQNFLVFANYFIVNEWSLAVNVLSITTEFRHGASCEENGGLREFNGNAPILNQIRPHNY